MKQTVAPRVSVLMTTHNGAALLAESLDSILSQRFDGFELIVVDDASTDATPALLADYAAREPRLRVLRPDRNLGVVGARNHGFTACRGAYVAMLDHDDLSHPDRLATQAAYLDGAPGVVLVGSEVLLLEAGRSRVTDHRAASNPLLLRWMLQVDNPLTWSSVMLRADAVRRLDGFLRPEAEFADDFDLYHRLLTVGEVARLDAVLTTYRWHATNTSHSAGGVLFDRAVRVLAAAYAAWLGPGVTVEATAAATLVVRHLSDRQPVPDAATLARLGDWLERLLAGFCARHATAPAERAMVAAHAAGLWWRVVRSAMRAGQPLAIRQARAWPELCQGPAPALTDRLGAFGIGLLRSHPGGRWLLGPRPATPGEASR
jgi:GT2 family glycosyltransferase